MKKTYVFAATILIAASATAQQLEVNSPGGNLTRAGVNPTIGCNFQVPAATGTCDLRIGGGIGMPFILVVGDLDFSTPIPFTAPTEYFDLDLTTYTIVGDGFGGTAGGIPPQACVLNGAGQFNLGFSSNIGLAGLTFAFQAAVYDAALPPLNLNLTAAGAYDFFVSPPAGPVPPIIGTQIGLAIVGDDSTALFALAATYNLYGAARTQVNASTNGLIRFGASANNGFSESAASFITSTIAPGIPQIAMAWEDHNYVAANGGGVRVFEDSANKTLQIRYENGNYFGLLLPTQVYGTMVCTVQEFSLPVVHCTVTLDFTAFAPVGTPPSEGIVGVSDGTLLTLPNQQSDLVCGSNVLPYSAPGDFSTYFQTFDGLGGAGTPPAQAIDVGNKIITFTDISLTGSGQWVVN